MPTRRELVLATRTRILDAAGRLTRDRGAGSWSMDVLAKEAGVARATIYEHFRSKRAVLNDLAASTARQVTIDAPSSTETDPLRALRVTLAEVCRHWSAHETTMRALRTLSAMTGTDDGSDAVDDASLRALVDALAVAGQLRSHWNAQDAVDALTVLTSYPTYDRLRRSARTAEQIEAILAKLAIAIVAPGTSAN
ncbi:MAG: TetR/AcrR family transcriptional regulator [Actinomycetota bacterium]